MHKSFDRITHRHPIVREEPDWIDNGEQSARCPDHPTLAICARNCDVIDLVNGTILKEDSVGGVRCIAYIDQAEMRRVVPVMNLYATALIPKDWPYSYIRFLNGNHNNIAINNVAWVKMPIEDQLYSDEIIAICNTGGHQSIVTLWDGLETQVTAKMLSLALGVDLDVMSYRLNSVIGWENDKHISTCISTNGIRITDVYQSYSYGIDTVLAYFKTFMPIDVEVFSIFEDTLYAGNNTDFLIYN